MDMLHLFAYRLYNGLYCQSTVLMAVTRYIHNNVGDATLTKKLKDH